MFRLPKIVLINDYDIDHSDYYIEKFDYFKIHSDNCLIKKMIGNNPANNGVERMKRLLVLSVVVMSLSGSVLAAKGIAVAPTVVTLTNGTTSYAGYIAPCNAGDVVIGIVSDPEEHKGKAWCGTPKRVN